MRVVSIALFMNIDLCLPSVITWEYFDFDFFPIAKIKRKKKVSLTLLYN